MVSGDKFPGIIFFVGVDGAGKTLYTNMLLKELKKSGLDVCYVWSRYNNFLSKPLLALTRLSGHNYKEYHHGVEFGYHDFGRPKMLSSLFTILQIIDLNLATYFKIRRRSGESKVLICDRGPYDTLIDVMLDTNKTSLIKKYEKLFFAILPKKHVVLYIYRPLAEIYKHRPELKYDKSLSIKDKLYQICYNYFCWRKFYNIGSPDIVFEKMVTCLNENQNTSQIYSQ